MSFSTFNHNETCHLFYSGQQTAAGNVKQVSCYHVTDLPSKIDTYCTLQWPCSAYQPQWAPGFLINCLNLCHRLCSLSNSKCCLFGPYRMSYAHFHFQPVDREPRSDLDLIQSFACTLLRNLQTFTSMCDHQTESTVHMWLSESVQHVVCKLCRDL